MGKNEILRKLKMVNAVEKNYRDMIQEPAVYKATETVLKNEILKPNNKITKSQLFRIMTGHDIYNTVAIDILRTPQNNHPAFIQGREVDILDVVFNGFMTDADIAEDLNISYTKAKRLLSPNFNLKNTPKIHHTVKLWHVVDDKHPHFEFIKNKKKRPNHQYSKYKRVNNYVCGKRKRSKTVVGMKDYIDFIENYYDPKYTNPKQLDHVLSKYKVHILKQCKNYTTYEIYMKFIQMSQKLRFYKYVMNTIKEQEPYVFTMVNNVIAGQRNRLLLDHKSELSRPRYPKYKSQSKLINRKNRNHYKQWQRVFKKHGGFKGTIRWMENGCQ